tara:strand:- start:119 stop:322 length:204 start_codon:yes stop_codon:yes gene_type:complete
MPLLILRSKKVDDIYALRRRGARVLFVVFFFPFFFSLSSPRLERTDAREETRRKVVIQFGICVSKSR